MAGCGSDNASGLRGDLYRILRRRGGNCDAGIAGRDGFGEHPLHERTEDPACNLRKLCGGGDVYLCPRRLLAAGVADGVWISTGRLRQRLVCAKTCAHEDSRHCDGGRVQHDGLFLLARVFSREDMKIEDMTSYALVTARRLTVIGLSR